MSFSSFAVLYFAFLLQYIVVQESGSDDDFIYHYNVYGLGST